MISWHKKGQRVMCIALAMGVRGNRHHAPRYGEMYTISDVEITIVPDVGECVGFELEERSSDVWFCAELFEPVYPTIIDHLRKLDAPTPERVKEDAHV